MSHQLKLFIKPGCPWCMQATSWLTNEGYRYREIDVIANDAAFEEMKSLSGQTFAPTLLVENDSEEADGDGAAGKDGNSQKILADFDVDDLQQFLKDEGVKPHKA